MESKIERYEKTILAELDLQLDKFYFKTKTLLVVKEFY